MKKSQKSNHHLAFAVLFLSMALSWPCFSQDSRVISVGGTEYDNSALGSVSTSDNGHVLVYQTANFSSGMGVGSQLCKFNQNGQLEWSRHIQSDDKVITVYSIIQLKDNNYLIAGEDLGASEFSNFISKIDQNGNLLWTKAVMKEFTQANSSAINQMVEDNDGNLVGVGWQMIAGERKGLILKLDKDGAVLWSKTLSINTDLRFNAIDIDSSNSIYATGAYDVGLLDHGLVITKMNADGSNAWIKDIQSYSDTLLFEPNHIRVFNQSLTVSGIIDHVGTVKDPQGGDPLPLPDGFIVFADLQGTINESKLIIGEHSSVITDVLRKDDYLYVSHYSSGGANLTKIDLKNDTKPFAWTQTFGRSNDETKRISAKENKLLISGIDRNSGKTNLKGEALSLSMLIEVNEDGNYPCASTSSDVSLTYVNHSVSASSPSLSIDNSYKTKQLLHSGTEVDPYFIVGCSALVGLEKIKTKDQEIRFYPNPASNQATIKWQNMQQGKCTISIVNAFGQEVIKQFAEGNTSTISTEILPVGIYYLSVDFENGESTVLKFIKR